MDFEERANKKVSIAKIIIIIVILALCLTGLGLVIFCRQLFGDEVGDLILGAGIENGFVAMGNFFIDNIRAIVSTLIIIAVILVVSSILAIITNLIFRGTPRKRTIASLLKSLIRYSSVILAICFILGAWGVDVAAIFASLGVVALIIGLGCKTLVNDIVSGFFIVVDNYFQVGDKVTIDDFTGYIYSVGLRSTKIKSWDGNIKTITNSNIITVINLTKFDSVAEVKIDLSFNEDLKRVEAILAKRLPEVKEQIGIISSLKYEGVNALDECGVQLLFHADVNENDRVPAERAILRALYLLFKEESILIPFKQVVVNSPDPTDRPKASNEEIEVSDKLMGYTKPKETKKKKKSLISSAVENIKKATEDIDE